MKKSLIALAVAGVVSAPAFAATSNVDVYGRVNIAIEDTNVTGTDIAVTDRVSYIGFKGSEDLGGGMKAIWQIEQQINATSTPNASNSFFDMTDVQSTTTSGGVSGAQNSVSTSRGAFGGAGLRNTYIGLSGGFGTVLMGRHDTPYKLGTVKLDPFADSIADYNGMPDGVSLIDSVQDHRSPQALAYISPTWSGFHFAVAAVATNDVGNLNNGDTLDATSATAIYENGPLFLSASYQGVEVVDSTAWKLGAGYSFGNLKVGAVYEDVEYDALSVNRDSWLVNAVYSMGAIGLKAEYGQADVATADQDAWALGVDYNFSKRTTAYAIYSNGDNDSGDDVSGWSLGMKHSF